MVDKSDIDRLSEYWRKISDAGKALEQIDERFYKAYDERERRKFRDDHNISWWDVSREIFHDGVYTHVDKALHSIPNFLGMGFEVDKIISILCRQGRDFDDFKMLVEAFHNGYNWAAGMLNARNELENALSQKEHELKVTGANTAQSALINEARRQAGIIEDNAQAMKGILEEISKDGRFTDAMPGLRL